MKFLVRFSGLFLYFVVIDSYDLQWMRSVRKSTVLMLLILRVTFLLMFFS